MRRLFLVVSGWLLAVGLSYAQTATMPPDQLVKTTTERILQLIKENRVEYQRDQQKLYAMVDREVLPHFDFRAMSRQVLAQNWRTATQEQQERFVKEFRDLLVRTYATALLKYNDEEVRYHPLRASPEDKQVLVRTEIIQKGGAQPVPINYSFFRTDAGWKVYDVSVAGVSLVTNYRGAYADRVRTQGLDALINSMAEANRRGQVDVKAPGSDIKPSRQ
jgi:phospholipid transport system substrate-binding protein